jgi:hypothetical protein
VFNRVEANNNAAHGIAVDGAASPGTNTVNATVSESVAAGNRLGGQGAGFLSTGSALTSLMVFHSVATNNDIGIAATFGATLRLANSAVTGNAAGWFIHPGDGSVGGTYSDNYIDGNGTNTGSLTPVSKQ